MKKYLLAIIILAYMFMPFTVHAQAGFLTGYALGDSGSDIGMTNARTTVLYCDTKWFKNADLESIKSLKIYRAYPSNSHLLWVAESLQKAESRVGIKKPLLIILDPDSYTILVVGTSR